MIIAERTLKDTCTYLVTSYKRCLETDKDGRIYAEHFHKLAGLSLLFVGRCEKKHVSNAIDNLKSIRDSKHSAVAARPSAYSAAELGQGGNQ